MIKLFSGYLRSTIMPVLLTLTVTYSIVIGSVLEDNSTAYADHKTAQTILVLGDSLSGAFGLDTDDGWVTLLQQHLSRQGYGYKVVNASVSGDTTRTGLSRIEPALKTHDPAIVIIALGGNDGLRGLPFSEIENSLDNIIGRCIKQGAQVLLVGVRLPPNYGPVYTGKFAELYRRLADKYDIPLVPKMLDKVADNRALMQADGMHPKAEAQPQVMENIWAGLKPLLATK